MRSFVATLGIAVAALAAAASATPATSTVSLTVSPSTVHRGHVVTIRGNAGDCPTGDAVTIISRAFVHTHDFAGVPAVFAKVHSGGSFSTSTRIPSTKHVAHYRITARCGGGNLGKIARLHVLA